MPPAVKLFLEEESIDDVILNIEKEGVRQDRLVEIESIRELEDAVQNNIDKT